MSKLIETRADFRQLADGRLNEAAVLLAQAKWSGAYSPAGYAVELALKACIIKKLMATDAFPAKDFSRDCYTHDVETLLELAGLDVGLDAAMNADPVLEKNWKLAIDWSAVKRYHLITEAEPKHLFNAIADAAHGVLTWIKTHW